MKPKKSLAGFFTPFLTVCVAAISLILTDNVSTLAYSRSEYSQEHQEKELKARINRVRKNSDSSQFNKDSLVLSSERLADTEWNNWANWTNWSNWDNW